VTAPDLCAHCSRPLRRSPPPWRQWVWYWAFAGILGYALGYGRATGDQLVLQPALVLLAIGVGPWFAGKLAAHFAPQPQGEDSRCPPPSCARTANARCVAGPPLDPPPLCRRALSVGWSGPECAVLVEDWGHPAPCVDCAGLAGPELGWPGLVWLAARCGVSVDDAMEAVTWA
jgi:hypothetical protein